MNNDLNILYGDGADQDGGLARGLAQLGLAGAADLVHRLLGTGSASAEGAARARYDAQVADDKARAARRRAQDGWSQPVKLAHNTPHAMKALQGVAPDRVRRGSHVSLGSLKEVVYRAMQNHLYEIQRQNPDLRRLTDEQPFEASDFVWRGPEGPDHGVCPEIGALNLGRGGTYSFNRVHDMRRPPEWRDAYSRYFESVARLYALTTWEAGYIAMSEAFDPAAGHGIARFGVDAGSVPDTLNAADAGEAVLYTQDHSILHVIKSVAHRMKHRDVGVFHRPEQARDAAAREISGGQYFCLKALTERLHRDTQQNVGEMALRLAQQAGVKLSQANDDMSFAAAQHDAIRRGCLRERDALNERCRLAVTDNQKDINEDTLVGATVGTALSGGNPAPALAALAQWSHRTARERRKSSECREAFREYAENVCTRRILPRGVVRISTHPNTEKRPPDA